MPQPMQGSPDNTIVPAAIPGVDAPGHQERMGPRPAAHVKDMVIRLERVQIPLSPGLLDQVLGMEPVGTLARELDEPERRRLAASVQKIEEHHGGARPCHRAAPATASNSRGMRIRTSQRARA